MSKQDTEQMTYIVGFTGTRAVITPIQAYTLGMVFSALNPKEAHHGDCKGADQVFHQTCMFTKTLVVTHPCNIQEQRGFCEGATTELPIKDPLERNRDIVDQVEIMLATPHTLQEELRSGTWATIRYARRVHKPLAIIYPNGSVESTDWGSLPKVF